MRYRLLAHSAKGTQWDEANRKYIKVEDGKYYYPDDYKGGRHLPKDEKPDASTGEPAGWESKFYSEFESNLNRIGGKLDPKQIQELLLFGKNSDGSKWDNFAVALAEHAGIDSDKIDPNVLNAMRYKVVDHYKKEFEKEKENFDKEGNRISNKKSSKSSKSEKLKDSKSAKSTKSTKSTKKEKKQDLAIDKVDKSRAMHAPKNPKDSSSHWSEVAANRKKIQNIYTKQGRNKNGSVKHGIEIPRYVIRPTGIHW